MESQILPTQFVNDSTHQEKRVEGETVLKSRESKNGEKYVDTIF